LSQSELVELVGTIAVTIERYERGEIKPSIDIASKISNALEVSLDWLVGATDEVLEKSLKRKISDIQKLPEDKKYVAMSLIDSYLTQTKLQAIL
jgi:transcriptional regulator with XRE-family HTH domain